MLLAPSPQKLEEYLVNVLRAAATVGAVEHAITVSSPDFMTYRFTSYPLIAGDFRWVLGTGR